MDGICGVDVLIIQFLNLSFVVQGAGVGGGEDLVSDLFTKSK